jgi:hypothetical protein
MTEYDLDWDMSGGTGFAKGEYPYRVSRVRTTVRKVRVFDVDDPILELIDKLIDERNNYGR